MKLEDIVKADCYIDCDSNDQLKSAIKIIEEMGIEKCDAQSTYGVDQQDDTISITSIGLYATIPKSCVSQKYPHYAASLFLTQTTA